MWRMQLRILIVDDIDDSNDIIKESIKQSWLDGLPLQVTIFQAYSYDDAKVIIEREYLDLAIVDLSIPYDDSHKKYPIVRDYLQGGIAVLDLLQARCAMVVISSYGSFSLPAELERQYGVHHVIDKGELKDFSMLHRICADALLRWRWEQAQNALKKRPILKVHLQNNNHFWLEYIQNGTSAPANALINLDDTADLIRRMTNVYHLMIDKDKPDPTLWRPEIKSIGQVVYEQLQRHPKFIEFLTLLRNANGGNPKAKPVIRFLIEPNQLEVPFDIVYDGDNHLVFDFPLTKHLRHLNNIFKNVAPFYQQVREIQDNHQKNIRVLLIGANSDGRIPQAEQEAQELEHFYNMLKTIYNLPISITLLTGVNANKNKVEDTLSNGRFNIIHYAGHSNFHPTSGELSYLYLRDGDRHGFITASDLYTYLKEHPLWMVFFSSCWSAHSAHQPQAHSSVDGILPAVSKAGAPLIVGYRWSVSDQSAHKFALDFHEHLWTSFIPSEALFEARKRLTVRNARLNDETWVSATLITQVDD
jgi:hypothetical protein